MFVITRDQMINIRTIFFNIFANNFNGFQMIKLSNIKNITNKINKNLKYMNDNL